MTFWAVCLSIRHFQLLLYHPALAEPLPLLLQLAFMHQQFLSQHHPQSISLSLHFLNRVFLVIPPLQVSFWFPSCAMPQQLGPFLLPRRSSLHSLDDIIGGIALSIYNICQPEVAKSAFLEH